MDKLIDLMNISKELFLKITDIGAIAGSAAVYAVTDMPKEIIGDVDIYVRDKYEFLTVVKLLCESFPDIEMNLLKHTNSKYTIHIHTIFRLMNMTRKDEIQLQIIGMSVFDPSEFIQYFDFDYVKCYFHKRKMHISPAAAVCHESKIITIDPSKMYLRSRLDKVYQKGFRFSNEHIPLYNRNIRIKEDVSYIVISCIDELTKIMRIDYKIEQISRPLWGTRTIVSGVSNIEYKNRNKENHCYPYLRAAFYDIDIIPEIIDIIENYLFWKNAPYLTNDDFKTDPVSEPKTDIIDTHLLCESKSIHDDVFYDSDLDYVSDDVCSDYVFDENNKKWYPSDIVTDSEAEYLDDTDDPFGYDDYIHYRLNSKCLCSYIKCRNLRILRQKHYYESRKNRKK